MDTREQRIREEAHRLWEQEGRPHGRDEHHWFQAAEIVARQEEAAAAPADAAPPLGAEAPPEAAPATDGPVSAIETVRRTLEPPAKRRGRTAPLADRVGAMSGNGGARSV